MSERVTRPIDNPLPDEVLEQELRLDDARWTDGRGYVGSVLEADFSLTEDALYTLAGVPRLLALFEAGHVDTRHGLYETEAYWLFVRDVGLDDDRIDQLVSLFSPTGELPPHKTAVAVTDGYGTSHPLPAEKQRNMRTFLLGTNRSLHAEECPNNGTNRHVKPLSGVALYFSK